MSIFLDSEELVELTGFKTSRKQIEALTRGGFKFTINHRFGKPIVLRKEVENTMTSSTKNMSAAVDFQALEALSHG